MPLPWMMASRGLSLAQRLPLSPQAQALAGQHADPSALLQALGQQGLHGDSVQVLASGMEPRHGVYWASQSAAQVSGKLPAHEIQAYQTAEAWVKGGASERQLAGALQQTQLAGPGSWSAQAAQWSAQGASLGTGPAAVPLAPQAIQGSVKLAAAVNTGAYQVPALPQVPTAPNLTLSQIAMPTQPGAPSMVSMSQLTPPQLQAMNKALEPFVQLGMKIAAGQSPIG